MGKISEALKKASKEERTRPSKQEDNGSGLEQTITAPDSRQAASQSRRAPVENVKNKRTERPTAPVKPPARVETPQPVLQADEPLSPEVNDLDTALSEQQEDAILSDQPQQVREHENTNISVLRTPTPEKVQPATPSGRAPLSRVRTHETVKAAGTKSGRSLQISYSKTKVQAIDPEKLKNNKIFSIFDDIETTEQIKILRTQVLKKLKAIGGNSILVTSANPYEGKTFTSINLGVSIAKEFDRTVLIIDADLRKPTKRHTAFSTEFFTLDVEVGLTDFLKEEADIPDILINPGINKLTLIPGGKPVDNAPELLNSNRMEEMMSEIKSRYASDRLVIVDGPAMLPFPDVSILSRYVDGVLLVVEVEGTPVDQVKKMMDRLKDARILGTVLNKNRGK
jgi:protein-tyrosine kinase